MIFDELELLLIVGATAIALAAPISIIILFILSHTSRKQLREQNNRLNFLENILLGRRRTAQPPYSPQRQQAPAPSSQENLTTERSQQPPSQPVPPPQAKTFPPIPISQKSPTPTVQTPPIIRPTQPYPTPPIPPVQNKVPNDVVKGKKTPRSKWGKIESLIGGTWINRIGAIFIIFCIGYFAKYCFERNLLPESVRVAIGFTLGIGIAVLGEWLHRKGKAIFSQGISGIGIAVLYITGFMSFQVYEVFSQPVAFSIMCLITAFAFFHSLNRNSQATSILAAIGGYLTPILLASGTANELALYSYIALLTAGIALVTIKRPRWVALDIISIVGVFGLFLLVPKSIHFGVRAMFLSLFWLIFHTTEMYRLMTNADELIKIRFTFTPAVAIAYYTIVQRQVYPHSHDAALWITLSLAVVFALSLLLIRKSLKKYPSVLARFASFSIVLAAISFELVFTGYTVVVLFSLLTLALAYTASKFQKKFLYSLTILGICATLVRVAGIENFAQPIIKEYYLLNFRYPSILLISGVAFLSSKLIYHPKRRDLRIVSNAFSMIGWGVLMAVTAMESYSITLNFFGYPETHFLCLSDNTYHRYIRTRELALVLSSMSIYMLSLLLFVATAFKGRNVLRYCLYVSAITGAIGVFGVSWSSCSFGIGPYLYSIFASAFAMLSFVILLTKSTVSDLLTKGDKFFRCVIDFLFSIFAIIGVFNIFSANLTPLLDYRFDILSETLIPMSFTFLIISTLADITKRIIYRILIILLAIITFAFVLWLCANENISYMFSDYFAFTFSVFTFLSFSLFYSARMVHVRIRSKFSAVCKYIILVIGIILTGFLMTKLLTSYLDYLRRIDELSMNVDDAGRFLHFSHLTQMGTSLIWILYAGVLLTIGFIGKSRWLRFFALGIIAIIIVKIFAFDLEFLATIHRMLLMFGAGIVLLVLSWLYNRYSSIIHGENIEKKDIPEKITEQQTDIPPTSDSRTAQQTDNNAEEEDTNHE